MSDSRCQCCQEKTRMRCPACKYTYICSKACQKKIWQKHKLECKTMALRVLFRVDEERDKHVMRRSAIAREIWRHMQQTEVPYYAVMSYFPILNEYRQELIETAPWRFLGSDIGHTRFLPSHDEVMWDTISGLFIHVPKCAGMSIVASLDKSRYACFGHVRLCEMPAKLWGIASTIVRNPFDRAVSAYFWMRQGGFNRNAEYVEIRSKYPDFHDWVRRGLTKDHALGTDFYKYGWIDPIVRQTYWLSDQRDISRIMPACRVGRLESIEADSHRLFDIPKGKLGRENTSNHADWRTYYKDVPDIVEKIVNLYARDFEWLGYSTVL